MCRSFVSLLSCSRKKHCVILPMPLTGARFAGVVEQVKRAYGHPGVGRWMDGARPDTWFTYRFERRP